MHQHNIENKQTVRAQLNNIADQRTTHDEYPDEISQTDVQELSQHLYKQTEALLETYITDTPFTRREANVWALITTFDEHRCFLTEDAVALVLSTPGTGFDDPTGPEEETEQDRSVTSQEVQHHHEAAKQKFEAARDTLKTLTFPAREDALDNPTIAWLEQETVTRLTKHRQPTETLHNDTVTRLLDETETQRTLEEFANVYLFSRGQDNVAQLAIERQSFETGALQITAHTAVQEELPDFVTETDAITYHGHRYDLHFSEDPSGPQELGRITLYASDNIIGMDGTTLEEGLDAADDHMRALLDRDEPLPSRRID